MYKIIVRNRNVFPKIKNLRFLTGAPRPDEPLFQKKDDFPSRHIGPRDRDIISMLDLLGFKVFAHLKLFRFLGCYKISFSSICIRVPRFVKHEICACFVLRFHVHIIQTYILIMYLHYYFYLF